MGPLKKKKKDFLVFIGPCMLSHFSHVQVFMTPWTVVLQAPLSTRFSRQEYWSGFPCPPSGDLPNPGIEPASPVDPAGGFFTTEPPRKPQNGPHQKKEKIFFFFF